MKCPLGLPLLLALLFSLPARARQQAPSRPPSQPSRPPAASRASSAPTYPNTSEGLRQLLTAVAGVARTGNSAGVRAGIKDMEIPNAQAWLARIFGPAEGKTLAADYARDLAARENELLSFFQQIAQQEGEFRVRKVNDEPRGLEFGSMVQHPSQHVDFYFASWQARAAGGGALAYPYFAFVDGKFRWDILISDLQRIPSSSDLSDDSEPSPARAPDRDTDRVEPEALPSLRPAPPDVATREPDQPPASASNSKGPFTAGKDGVGYPSCLSCPAPMYPLQARADGIEGTVVLDALIQPDGRAADIHLVRTDALIFIDPAIDAVRSWRFKPATGPDGKPVPVRATLEVGFRLTR